MRLLADGPTGVVVACERVKTIGRLWKVSRWEPENMSELLHTPTRPLGESRER